MPPPDNKTVNMGHHEPWTDDSNSHFSAEDHLYGLPWTSNDMGLIRHLSYRLYSVSHKFKSSIDRHFTSYIDTSFMSEMCCVQLFMSKTSKCRLFFSFPLMALKILTPPLYFPHLTNTVCFTAGLPYLSQLIKIQINTAVSFTLLLKYRPL